MLIMGEGDFFCAGGDLTMLIKAQEMSEDQRRARIDALNDLMRAVVACPARSSPWSRVLPARACRWPWPAT
ncbi:hypothetical protein FLP41_19265 [Paracoccus marcusii]|uniref:hypothetical protein n=1 Tax=Paracoccus marcusii TaxID=59779 RepID=UPI002ED46905|nr:hypothetical protein FLP41_19265 [Paracoccus marcusii]